MMEILTQGFLILVGVLIVLMIAKAVLKRAAAIMRAIKAENARKLKLWRISKAIDGRSREELVEIALAVKFCSDYVQDRVHSENDPTDLQLTAVEMLARDALNEMSYEELLKTIEGDARRKNLELVEQALESLDVKVRR
jgi:hypothetical protein